MSSYASQRILTFKAAAILSKGMCVKAGADAKHVDKSAAATSKNIGIVQNDCPAIGDLAEVALPGGGGKAVLGSGGCAFGDLLTADSGGALVVTTTPGDRYIAIAMDAGAQGDLVSVEVVAGLI